MELVLQQKQTLNLVMTTELRQAIQLLQYSTYELYQFLQDQQLENPLIELEEKVPDVPYHKPNRNNKTADTFDYIANQEKGMRENLIEQMQWLDITEDERRVVHYLILNLDENGYLPLNTEEIAENSSIDKKEIDNGIKLLQQLEPVGVGARNLQECLLLQATHYYPEEPLLECVIREHLDLLANKKWNTIAKQLDVSLSEVKIVNDCLQNLDPKPCSCISNFQADYLNPDIIVEPAGNGFSVYLNDGYLPQIRLNSQYADFLTSKNEVSSYIQENYKSYQWLVNSLEQRRSTILKIVNVIVRKQYRFLMNGFQALQPLTLKEVADEINMHESTVSRATMNKVIQTPKGAYDIRSLFASKLATSDGNSASQTKVKLLLKDIVENESKQKPFSDQKIADYFKTKKGITISRRTVAKYREELKIPSSSKRKEIDI
ncbi:RNA polymerase factor sigma-54 [Virgibacillus dakarensis]|uniref:RNA polymerase sigma-54 factor n=1 Tax=Lentibacillus populi TaxID=1827502 RepID=A0A9W5X768_9BACI|nr:MULTISPECIES: RNA polymerase factor sigma-54 [Bacillaceae]MBT2216219.1 RNA polymerase factor sigma-54 [Virgibacillus dakarensis]MTW88059.1 RNA polymerase factor sigma-54 [Virgibacillus dakarensis]GGB53483.1 RNA polymerase sigma-54 factor [Lentibacillus populi]